MKTNQFFLIFRYYRFVAIHVPTNHIVGDNREKDHWEQSHGNDITEDLGEEEGRHSIKTAHIFMPVGRENNQGYRLSRVFLFSKIVVKTFLFSPLFIPINIYIVLSDLILVWPNIVQQTRSVCKTKMCQKL